MLGVAFAADPTPVPENFAFWVTSGDTADVSIAPGAKVEFTLYLRADEGTQVQGWSLALCHDGTVVRAIDPNPGTSPADASARALAMTAGTGTATVKEGGKPDFNSVNVYPEGGVTQGVIIDFSTVSALAATPKFSMIKIQYEGVGAAGAKATLRFCDADTGETLGAPAVDNVVVVGGMSYKPATRTGGSIEIMVKPILPTITATATASELRADMVATDEVKVEIALAADSTPAEVQGWSYGLTHDNAKLTLVDANSSATVSALRGGAGPDFYNVNTNPAGGAGVAVAAIVSMSPPFEFIALAGGQKIHTETMKYRSAVELKQANGDQAVDTRIQPVSEVLGNPAVAAVIVVAEEGIEFVQKMDATILLTPMPAGGVLRKFRRGDSNNDGVVNIADGIWILSYAYRGGRVPPCLDAADANDDGRIDQTDAIVVIYYQLLNGAPPKAPFDVCGTDPSDTSSDTPEDSMSCMVDGNGCARR
jgi:hypothetical protein